jgi:TM2 domain-containing membrane protein YozV
MSQNAITKPSASPILAAACSIIWGMGALYNGQMSKWAVLVLIMWLGCMICALPGVFIWVLGIIDAYQTAQRLESGESLPENEYSLPLLYNIAKIIDQTATCSRA